MRGCESSGMCVRNPNMNHRPLFSWNYHRTGSPYIKSPFQSFWHTHASTYLKAIFSENQEREKMLQEKRIKEKVYGVTLRGCGVRVWESESRNNWGSLNETREKIFIHIFFFFAPFLRMYRKAMRYTKARTAHWEEEGCWRRAGCEVEKDKVASTIISGYPNRKCISCALSSLSINTLTVYEPYP